MSLSFVLLPLLLSLAQAQFFTSRTTCGSAGCSNQYTEITQVPLDQCFYTCDACANVSQAKCVYLKYTLSGQRITRKGYSPFDVTCAQTAFFTDSFNCGDCVTNPTVIGACPICIELPPSKMRVCGGVCPSCDVAIAPTSTSTPTPPIAPTGVPTGAVDLLEIASRIVKELNSYLLPNETALRITGCDNKATPQDLCHGCPIFACTFAKVPNEFIINSSILIPRPFTIPTNVGLMNTIQLFRISDNPWVRAPIPTEVFNLRAMLAFTLYNCKNFGGTIPRELDTGLPSLYALQLTGSGIGGTISDKIGPNHPALKLLLLYRNNLNGTLPDSIVTDGMTLLDVSENLLTGPLPVFSKATRTFHTFNAAQNLFSGQIPNYVAPPLESVFVGFNNLEGTIPSFFKGSRWRALSLPVNKVSGTVPSFRVDLGLDLTYNQFSGDIPQIYGDLYDLRLKGNRFTGFSPAFEKPPSPLNFLTRIDVSENNLTTFPEILLSSADSNFPILTEIVAAKNYIQQEFMPKFSLKPILQRIDFTENLLGGQIDFLLDCQVAGRLLDCSTKFTLTSANSSGLIYDLKFDSNRLIIPHATVKVINSGAVAFTFLNLNFPAVGDRFNANLDAIFFIPVGKQDKDECADETHDCQQLCVDGWSPLFSYTCACVEGFQLSVTDGVSCVGYLTGGQVAGIVIGILLALVVIIALVLAYLYYTHPLNDLPRDVRWSFVNKLTRPWMWEYCGSKSSGYYLKKYQEGSAEWKKVEAFRMANFEGPRDELLPSEIFAIYNPTLTISFINAWKITVARRKNDPTFFKQYVFNSDPLKSFVFDCYQKVKEQLPWNRDDKDCLVAPLLLALHGTDFNIAEKIAQTGFASLSKLDAGYFGKGIYFTTILPYTIPYCCTKRKPAVIVSYLNMGNVYAVTEHHKGPSTLMGTALQSGYNSHYVLTDPQGNVYNQKNTNNTRICNEIVIGQESQILPAFLISLDLASCRKSIEQWKRMLPTNIDELAYFDANARDDDVDREQERQRHLSLESSIEMAGQTEPMHGTDPQTGVLESPLYQPDATQRENADYYLFV